MLQKGFSLSMEFLFDPSVDGFFVVDDEKKDLS